MKGSIIGDMIGSVYRLNNTLDYNFPILSEKSTFTVCTLSTVAIMDALINNHSYDRSLHDWCNKYSDYSYQTINGINPLVCISPISLLDISPQVAFYNTRLILLCYHSNSTEQIYATIYVLILRRLRLFHKKEVALETMRDGIGKLWREFLPEKGKFSDTVNVTLPLAVHLFIKSQSFEDAIRLAVSYGGDSASLATIVGGLAESYYGISERLWNEVKFMLPKDMLGIIDKIYSLKGE